MEATTRKSIAEAVEPYKEQEPFLWDRHRYYGFISGVGAGKTATGVIRTAINAEVWNPGEMGAIVAPSASHIKKAIFPIMRKFGLRERWEYNSPQAEEPGFITPEGGQIFVLSASDEKTTERISNLNLAFWWIDEARETTKRARDILRERLRVGQYRNGCITTTPWGFDHNYDFFKGDPEEDEELESYGWGDYEPTTIYEGYDDRLCVAHVPSWANPHNPKDFREEMRNLPEDIRQQQAEGLFVEFKGRVYPWFDRKKHVVDEVKSNYRQVFYGLDWGRRNPFCILAVALTNRNEYAVLDMVYKTGLDYDQQVAEATTFYENYGPGSIYCDSAQPAAINMLKRDGIDARKSVKDLRSGIQYVSSLQDELKVVGGNCEELIQEFGAYRYPEDEREEEPVDANNHALDSLRYALMSHAKHGGRSTGVVPLEDRDVFG